MSKNSINSYAFLSTVMPVVSSLPFFEITVHSFLGEAAHVAIVKV